MIVEFLSHDQGIQKSHH